MAPFEISKIQGTTEWRYSQEQFKAKREALVKQHGGIRKDYYKANTLGGICTEHIQRVEYADGIVLSLKVFDFNHNGIIDPEDQVELSERQGVGGEVISLTNSGVNPNDDVVDWELNNGTQRPTHNWKQLIYQYLGKLYAKTAFTS
ncbi:MAG: hypothetical protein QE263_06895 [Vampirovibrionales bacterium]|nr:hypothetical protein [Vampirovibrionales bacterium]